MFWNKKKTLASILILLLVFVSIPHKSNAMTIVNTPLDMPQIGNNGVFAYFVAQRNSPTDKGYYLVTFARYYEGMPYQGYENFSWNECFFSIWYDRDTSNSLKVKGDYSLYENAESILDYAKFWATTYNLETGAYVESKPFDNPGVYEIAMTYVDNFAVYGFNETMSFFNTECKFAVGWSGGQQVTTPEQMQEATEKALEENRRKEEESAQETGDSSVSSGVDAVPNNSDSLKSALQNFIGAFTNITDDAYLEIPAIKLPAIPNVMDEIVLTERQYLVFKDWVNKIPCIELVRILCTIALCIYGVKEFYGLIYELLNNRKENVE